MTYMNLSGGPVAALAQFYKVEPEQIVAVHDELDMPYGQVRGKLGGGEGGHNGLRSMSKSLGTKDYLRVRFGIGRPPGRQDPADYVLSDFSAAERKELGLPGRPGRRRGRVGDHAAAWSGRRTRTTAVTLTSVWPVSLRKSLIRRWRRVHAGRGSRKGRRGVVATTSESGLWTRERRRVRRPSAPPRTSHRRDQRGALYHCIPRARQWEARYLRPVARHRLLVGLGAGASRFQARFGPASPSTTAGYLILSGLLPLAFIAASERRARAYDGVILFVGTDEYQRVIRGRPRTDGHRGGGLVRVRHPAGPRPTSWPRCRWPRWPAIAARLPRCDNGCTGPATAASACAA